MVRGAVLIGRGGGLGVRGAVVAAPEELRVPRDAGAAEAVVLDLDDRVLHSSGGTVKGWGS
jgi:hypothetical protein